MEDQRTVQIYVPLQDEGTDVWRPVEATSAGRDLYMIVSKNPNPGDEHWQFQTGDIVRCERKTFSGESSGLVAVEKVHLSG